MATKRIKVGQRIDDPDNKKQVAAAKAANERAIGEMIGVMIGTKFADGTLTHRVFNLSPSVQARTSRRARVNTTWERKQ